MDLVKTGIGLTKTIKNVSRTKEIVSVFWKNGFDEIISKTKLHNVIPGFVIPKVRMKNALEESRKNKEIWETIGFRLRKSFEELGPSFIKLGQLISSREDILDPLLIKELKQLQSNAGGVEFNEVKNIIEEAFNKPIEMIFKSFNEKPIGKASIGIVYEATLIDGSDVVVKVRRPGIKSILENDFEIISFIVSRLEKVSDELKYLGISKAIDDFFHSINLELNFLIEAQNCKKLRENITKIDKENIFVLPTVFDEYTRENILVMSKLDGTPFNQLGHVTKESPLNNILDESVKMFINTLLVDGFFHADLHGGNFFLLDDNKIGIIDFGLMGSISKKNKENLVAILLAVVTNNYENLVYEFLDVAEYDQIPQVDQLIIDVQKALTPYIGLSVQDIDATAFVNAIVTTLSTHHMYLPRQWFIIFRSLMTLDGVGKSLGLNINIFKIIDEQIHDIMSEFVSKDALLSEALWIGRDTLNSLRIIPRHIQWMLKEFSRKKYRLDVELVGVQNEIKKISNGLFFFSLMFFSSILIFSGVYLLKDITISELKDIPVIVWSLWAIATLAIFRASIFAKN
ncbi:MAG: AarF/UbiB family protein [Bacteriovoracaceae bacterium]|jgi:ubiquinone biosynthesis protein|nr:AarF/UbiB family protein [Bacteriovoracaceae bacterium]